MNAAILGVKWKGTQAQAWCGEHWLATFRKDATRNLQHPFRLFVVRSEIRHSFCAISLRQRNPCFFSEPVQSPAADPRSQRAHSPHASRQTPEPVLFLSGTCCFGIRGGVTRDTSRPCLDQASWFVQGHLRLIGALANPIFRPKRSVPRDPRCWANSVPGFGK